MGETADNITTKVRNTLLLDWRKILKIKHRNKKMENTEDRPRDREDRIISRNLRRAPKRKNEENGAGYIQRENYWSIS